MATLVHSAIQDRLINSVKSLQKGDWYDAMATQQDYPMLRMMMSMGKEWAGNKLSYRIGVGSENEAGWVGLYEDFDLDRNSVMAEGSLDWRNLQKGFPIDLRELDSNKDPESLVSDVEVLRNDMYQHISDDIEGSYFQVPASSDKLMPMGIPYFVPWKDESSTNGAFTTQTPNGHSTIAGIDPTVETAYRSWSDLYTNATRDDLGRKVSRAIRKTGWKPPPQTRGDEKTTHAIYMDLETIEENESMAANQNDQLGTDTQSMLNRSMMARIAPTWASVLDDNAASGSNPVYIINHAYLFPVFRKGWKFKEYPPVQAAKQQTVLEVTVHTVFNNACPLRNRQAVIAKSAPFGES